MLAGPIRSSTQRVGGGPCQMVKDLCGGKGKMMSAKALTRRAADLVNSSGAHGITTRCSSKARRCSAVLSRIYRRLLILAVVTCEACW